MWVRTSDVEYVPHTFHPTLCALRGKPLKYFSFIFGLRRAMNLDYIILVSGIIHFLELNYDLGFENFILELIAWNSFALSTSLVSFLFLDHEDCKTDCVLLYIWLQGRLELNLHLSYTNKYLEYYDLIIRAIFSCRPLASLKPHPQVTPYNLCFLWIYCASNVRFYLCLNLGCLIIL